MKWVVALVVFAAACATVNAQVGCTTCKMMVGKFETWLADNHTEEMIEAELEKLCGLLPNDLQFVCDQIVQQVPAIIAAIENKETPAIICAQLKICPALPLPEGTFECDACKMVIGSIEGWLESNQTVEEVEYLLDLLCALLGDTFEPICDRIVQIGVEEIITWINNNESPMQVCTQLGLCTSRPQPKPQGALLCDACKTIMGAIEGWVLSNKTVTEIEVLLDELCALLGPTFEPICDMIVKIGVEEVVTWIENNESPTQICTQLLLCPVPRVHMPFPPPPKVVGDTFWCEACHVLITAIEDWLEANKTVAEIEALIDQLCALLGEPFEEVCDAFVDIGIHKIIEWININENPEIVCQQIGLCSARPVHPMFKNHHH